MRYIIYTSSTIIFKGINNIIFFIHLSNNIQLICKMATKILLSDLNVEDKRILRRDLVLKGNPPYLGEPKIINFYKIVDKYVHVPLYYYQIKNSKLFVNHKYI